jgi:hypothetical protein
VKPNPQLKEVLNLVQTVPEWGSSYCIAPEKIMSPIFCPKQLEPEEVIVLPSKHSPEPFGHQTDVHCLGIHYPQATLAFGLADILPVHPMILLFGSLALPEEPISVLVKARMGAISQQK